MQQTRARLIQVFAQVLELVGEADIVAASMDTVPAWDSMGHIMLIISVEQEFRISFTPEEAALITSFTEIDHLVERKLM